MRILKGQEILPDDSTLVQQNISDDDTVSVLIEPDRNIEVEVQCGPKVYKHNISYCMTVKKLKMLLIKSNQVAFLFRDLVLIMTNKDVTQELDDDSMPMHYFTPETCIKLKAVSSTLHVTSENSFGETVHHNISRKGTVFDLIQVIKKTVRPPPKYFYPHTQITSSNLGELVDALSTIVLSGNPDKMIDLSLFVASGNSGYKRLDEADGTFVRDLLSEGDMVYYIEDKPSSNVFNCDWPVYHQNNNVGIVRGNTVEDFERPIPTSKYETVRTIKLRIQDDMGIPSYCITVYSRKGSKSNPRTENDIKGDDDQMKSDCYIEIK